VIYIKKGQLLLPILAAIALGSCGPASPPPTPSPTSPTPTPFPPRTPIPTLGPCKENIEMTGNGWWDSFHSPKLAGVWVTCGYAPDEENKLDPGDFSQALYDALMKYGMLCGGDKTEALCRVIWMGKLNISASRGGMGHRGGVEVTVYECIYGSCTTRNITLYLENEDGRPVFYDEKDYKKLHPRPGSGLRELNRQLAHDHRPYSRYTGYDPKSARIAAKRSV